MGMIGRGFKRFKRSLINSLACGSTSLLATEPPPPPPPPPHHHSDAPPSTALISDSALSEFGTSTAAPHDDPCAAPVAVVALASDADTPTSPPLPVDGDRSSASVLIIDLVSIHSGILSSSSEARRNPRSFFLDAFSRSSLGRDSDSPSVVFATSRPDHIEPRDRWLLDLTGDLHFDRATRESRYYGSRGRERGGQRWPSRYEMFHDVHDEHDWRASSLCDSGIHPRGTCFCDSPTAEEPSSSSRVSQIFMLADALFEVLEEIHRQRLSLSLSMVSIPAPEVVVDSLPLKSYKKATGADTGIDDVLQCHICLDSAETLYEKLKSSFPSLQVSLAYQKLKDANVPDLVRKGYDVVKDELYGTPNKRKHLEYTPPPPFKGELSSRTDIVVTPSMQPQWKKKLGAFVEKMRGNSVFKRINSLSEPVVTKGQEIAEDMRERWDTSDSPIVQKMQDVSDTIFQETDAAASIKEIRRRDPSFSMPDFVAEVQEATRPVLNAYLKGDVKTLKKYCSPEVINKFEAERKAFESHGIFFDNKILHISDVEVRETKMMGNSPLIIVAFQTQQVHCVRDRSGAITEGGKDTIHTVYYAWAMQQVDPEELEQGAIYPIWRLREMQQLGVQALI